MHAECLPNFVESETAVKLSDGFTDIEIFEEITRLSECADYGDKVFHFEAPLATKALDKVKNCAYTLRNMPFNRDNWKKWTAL